MGRKVGRERGREREDGRGRKRTCRQTYYGRRIQEDMSGELCQLKTELNLVLASVNHVYGLQNFILINSNV